MQTEKVKSERIMKPQVKTGRWIMNAIRYLKDPEGSSLKDIKIYISSRPHQTDVPSTEDMKIFIKKAINRGILKKVGQKYKIAEKDENKNIAQESVKRQQREIDDIKSKSALKKKKLDPKTKPEKSVLVKGSTGLKPVKVVRPQNKTGRRIIEAIRRLQNPEGSSLQDIKKYIISRLPQEDVPSSDEIQIFIKEAINRGTLEKVGRKYRIAEKDENKNIAQKSAETQHRVIDEIKSASNEKVLDPKTKPEKSLLKKSTGLKSVKVTNPGIKTGRSVMEAIRRLQNPEGSSLPDIKKYIILHLPQEDVLSSDDMKIFIKEAINRGTLVKVGGKYRIVEKDESKNIAQQSAKFHHRKIDITKSARNEKVLDPKTKAKKSVLDKGSTELKTVKVMDPDVKIRRGVMDAICSLQEPEGSSLPDIEKYLTACLPQEEMLSLKDVKKIVKDAVSCDILEKFGEKYKIVEKDRNEEAAPKTFKRQQEVDNTKRQLTPKKKKLDVEIGTVSESSSQAVNYVSTPEVDKAKDTNTEDFLEWLSHFGIQEISGIQLDAESSAITSKI